MRRWILFAVVLFLTGSLAAQDRTATVRLEGGRELVGRVIVMDLEQLQLQIGDEIVTVDADDIKSCRFGAEGEAAAGGPEGAATAAAAGYAQALIHDPDAVPVDGRDESRFGARMAVLDAVYPWLCPVSPAQWFSLGLLLFAALSLIIHGSARVAGAEAAAFGRSLALAAAYLLAAGLQLAFVPGNDLSYFIMLIGNAAWVLFAVRQAFALERASAIVAFAVQVGCLAVGLGLLQLVDSLLGSVSAT